jgi:hypothetical protein
MRARSGENLNCDSSLAIWIAARDGAKITSSVGGQGNSGGRRRVQAPRPSSISVILGVISVLQIEKPPSPPCEKDFSGLLRAGAYNPEEEVLTSC